MTTTLPDSTLAHFTTFGDLLKYLRRRAGLTQRELSIAVGYSTAQICRLEQNQRLPDLPTLAARFVPELGLADEPQAASRLLALAATVRREDAPATGLPPFKGLLYFDENDTDQFFGRESLTAQLTARLMAAVADPAGPRFLAVVGASGSGKSSVVRAGLIPALRWDPAAAGWLVHVLTPSAHPLEALAASVLGDAKSNTAQAALVDVMALSPYSLHHAVEQRAQRAGVTQALFVVDQFEELFTLCRSEAERRAFLDNLLTAAGSAPGPTAVVIALRADFYGHCADYPNLRAVIAQRQEYIGGMTAEDLRRAIEEPAKRGHWELEPGLVDQLLQDVGADGGHAPEPGALPLLSHALLETWQRRRGNALTLSGYAATGGVRGAIAETAEAVFHDQLTSQQRAIARHIFLRLTELGETDTVPDTRRRVGLEELIPQPDDAGEVRAVLTLLADARLIATDQDTVEVAHEALIREWPTLREWLAEDREGLRLQRRVTEAALEWERTGRDEAELHRGARLAQALEWAAAHPGTLNAREEAFLEAAQALVTREAAERDRQRQRELEAAQRLAQAEQQRATDSQRAAEQLRRRAFYFAGAFVVALVMAAAALFFGEQARQAALTAQASERVAFARELAAAAISNLEVDPERSLLLALHAGAVTDARDGQWTAEAEDALHRALEASRVELTLRGHTDLVADAGFSPDGQRIASVSDDGTLRVWDAATGQELLTIATGAPRGHHGLAFSPDGARLATAGAIGTTTVWETATGQALLTLAGHTNWVASVAYSPDGARLATASEDRTVVIWEAATGAELVTLTGHTDAVWAVAFSPDGRQVATASEDGTAKVWDAATGQALLTLRGRAGPLYSIAFSADGRQLATAADNGTAQLWEAATGAEGLVLRGHTAAVAGVAFSPPCADPFAAAASLCGPHLVTTGFDGLVRVWDTATGATLLSLKGHAGPVFRAVFNPTATRLVSAGVDGTVRVWNAGLSRELQTLSVPDFAASALSPACAAAPCVPRLALGFGDGTVTVWDLSGASAAPAALTLRGHPERIQGLAFSPDGTRLATAGQEGTAKIWDTATGQERLTLGGHSAALNTIAFSPDGARLATTSADYSVRVWDAATGQELLTLSLPPGVNAAVFGPACAAPCPVRLAVAGKDGTAQVFDAATGMALLTVRGHTGAVLGVAFSADGTRLATAGADGTARVWDAATGAALLTLAGHAGEVNGVAFNPGGGPARLTTISQDGTTKVWDLTTGREVLTLRGHMAPVVGLAYGAVCAAAGPCAPRLLTAAADGAVRFYLVERADLVALALTRVTRSWTTAECQQYLHLDACPVPAAPLTPAPTAVALSPAPATPATPANGLVCEVTDESGVNDQYFNQAAYGGVLAAAERYGWASRVLEARLSTDYAPHLTTLAQAGCDVIVIPSGFFFADVTRAVAEAYPEQKFVLMDVPLDPPLEQVWAQLYATDQAAFLAGYVAAAATKTGKVGTFGGIAFPPVTAFMDGYARGVAYYNAQHGTQVEVLGWDVEQQTGLFTGNFISHEDGRRMGAQLLDQGADIILPVAGGVGLGAAEVVQERGGAFLIGVDTDWAQTYPEFADILLTSIEKKVAVTVMLAVSAAVDDAFTGGTHVGTLATGEVGLAPLRGLDAALTAQLLADLEQITAGINAGQIQTQP